MIGAEQDLGSGPIILEAHGRGVETATHKYIAFDTGDTALYDLTVDPDGMNNIAADPVWADWFKNCPLNMTEFPAPPAPAATPLEPEVPKVAVPAPFLLRTAGACVSADSDSRYPSSSPLRPSPAAKPGCRLYRTRAGEIAGCRPTAGRRG